MPDRSCSAAEEPEPELMGATAGSSAAVEGHDDEDDCCRARSQRAELVRESKNSLEEEEEEEEANSSTSLRWAADSRRLHSARRVTTQLNDRRTHEVR